MKQLGLLALMGGLIWFAWQMGFQQAKHPGIGLVASEQRVIHSTLANPSVHQAAVTSERFLNHSARAIKYNSAQAWDSLKPQDQQAPPRSGYKEPNLPTPSGLTTVWQQAGRVISGLEPIAKTTWSLAQTSWKNITTDKSKSAPVEAHGPDSVATRQN